MILYFSFWGIFFLLFDVDGLLWQLADKETIDSPEERVEVKLVEESGEDIWHGHLKEWLTFEVSDPERPDGNFSIHLRHNRNVNVPRPIYVMREGRIVPQTVPALKHVEFYQGAEGLASIGITCELQKGGWKQFEVEGVLQRGDKSYLIYPERTSPDFLANGEFHRHILKRINQTEEVFETDYILPDNSTVFDEHLPHRPKRQGFKTYKVEMLVALDYSIYQYWSSQTSGNNNNQHELTLQSIQQYYAYFLNGIDLRYKNIKENDFAINVLHSGLFVADSSSVSVWTHGKTSPNTDNPERALLEASSALEAFTSWVGSRSDLPKHDHAMAFTSYDLSTQGKNSVAGLAYISGVCKQRATSISENFFSFRGLVTAAHELGHNLGSKHDGDGNSCDTDQQYIMSSVSGPPSAGTALHPWFFSTCSITQFRTLMQELDRTGSNCLLSENPGYDSNYLGPYLTTQPGQYYDGDTQCVYSLGQGSFVCRQIYESTGYAEVCSGLFCLMPDSSSCKRIFPAKGTSCGNRKWCVNGECVYDTNAPAVSDSCPFGDEPGVVTDGKTCSQLIRERSDACNYYSKPCCGSCSLNQPSQPTESPQQTQDTGCQYDQASYCGSITPGQCYSSAQECCRTCANYYNPDAAPGCEYGDLWDECNHSQCSMYSQTVRDYCCQTCSSTSQPNAPATTTSPWPTSPPQTTTQNWTETKTPWKWWLTTRPMGKTPSSVHSLRSFNSSECNLMNPATGAMNVFFSVLKPLPIFGITFSDQIMMDKAVANDELQEHHKKDFVYVYAPLSCGLVPSISPFALKLETWLRMMDIPYKTIPSKTPSTKTKQFPFVYLNGEEICDSNLIIRKLSDHFCKPIDSHLSQVEKAISLSFIRMVEEHTFQAYIWYRYVHASTDFWGCFNFSDQGADVVKRYSFVENVVKENVTQKSWHHGIGRKSADDIYAIAEADLEAMSSFLADKDFMMGDKTSLVDCALFGHFVQLFYIPFNFPPKIHAETKCPNLVSFTNRMRDRFFPDWDQRCQSKVKSSVISS
ncbi:uncharacterized protein LOC135464722 [Liolophura sinensis]|uniref:uncharacterized protein LOC135464722 n=1 Tax=Liolophura sinensis TaxID=3198878 RepID=UPI00315967F6